MKTLKIRLSSESVSKAVRELQEYKAGLQGKAQLLVKTLTDEGAEICRVKIAELDISDTGNLLSSIGGYYDSSLNAGFITADCEYAVFVEFGTGTKGVRKPYPGEAMARAGYKYMGGTRYITTKDGRIGWFYPAPDGTWKFTEGLPSRPFMYETAEELKRALQKTVKEVFG
ncbi:MAG: hypothetical protein ACI4I9_01700 [Porcipelethomonas sp.]